MGRLCRSSVAKAYLADKSNEFQLTLAFDRHTELIGFRIAKIRTSRLLRLKPTTHESSKLRAVSQAIAPDGGRLRINRRKYLLRATADWSHQRLA